MNTVDLEGKAHFQIDKFQFFFCFHSLKCVSKFYILFFGLLFQSEHWFCYFDGCVCILFVLWYFLFIYFVSKDIIFVVRYGVMSLLVFFSFLVPNHYKKQNIQIEIWITVIIWIRTQLHPRNIYLTLQNNNNEKKTNIFEEKLLRTARENENQKKKSVIKWTIFFFFFWRDHWATYARKWMKNHKSCSIQSIFFQFLNRDQIEIEINAHTIRNKCESTKAHISKFEVHSFVCHGVCVCVCVLLLKIKYL